MKKYRVSLEVDKEWVKNFDLVIEAEDEQEAEAEAMVEVKQNLGDYLTAYAEEEEENAPPEGWTEEAKEGAKQAAAIGLSLSDLDDSGDMATEFNKIMDLDSDLYKK